MSFLNSWALGIGAVAATLPVLIHFLTRPRPVTFPLSTIRFVRLAIEQRRARHRLRDILILACRTAAVLLIAIAVARPLWSKRPVVDAVAAGNTVRVVVLDVSQSMAAGQRGIQIFERARPLAAELLAYRPGLSANLILAGATPRAVFEQPSTNFSAIREELGRARPRPERLNLAAALNVAADMLAGASQEGVRKELVLVSDFQRSNWAAASFASFPQDTVIQLEYVAPESEQANLAILNVESSGRATAGQPIQLHVEVGNFSSSPRQVRAEIALGELPTSVEGLCPAGGKTVLTIDTIFPSAGWQTGQARLIAVDDALAADNQRSLVLNVRPNPTYVLLTRQPPESRPSSSYYLRRALVPFEQESSAPTERIVQLAPEKLDAEGLADADLALLDHPGLIPPAGIQLLTGFLRRGQGLLYVVAEPVDATNLRAIMNTAGADMRMPVEFSPPPAGQLRRDLFLTEIRKDDIPFGIFGDSTPSIVGPLRFSGGLVSRRLDGGMADELLASYSDRTACLVMTTCGAGSLAILNADLGLSNLPTSPAFVPLIGELTTTLMGRQTIEPARASGEPAAIYLPLDAGALNEIRLEAPSATSSDETDHPAERGELVAETGGMLWRFPRVGSPGVYKALRGDQTVFAISSALPAEESDLSSMEPSLLEGRLSGGRTVFAHRSTGPDSGKDDAWTWLAVACAMCLVGEITVLLAFRS